MVRKRKLCRGLISVLLLFVPVMLPDPHERVGGRVIKVGSWQDECFFDGKELTDDCVGVLLKEVECLFDQRDACVVGAWWGQTVWSWSGFWCEEVLFDIQDGPPELVVFWDWAGLAVAHAM